MIDVTKKELPEGWQWTTMEHIADVIGGGTPKSKEKIFFDDGEIPWLTPADLSGYTAKHISKGARNITGAGLNSSSAKLMPAGTVLFTSRAPIGYVAIATNEISTNQGFKSFVLKSEEILPDYVYWWLKGNKQLAESMASGTTFLELSGSKAKQLPIPISPPEQQKRIVAKIEELFSHIDAGIEALKKAKQLLKQYRQSVLKAAVTGELTKEWREANKDKLEFASRLLECILIERRQKWEELQLEQFNAKGNMPKNEKWKEKYKEANGFDADINIPEEWVGATTDQVFYYVTSGSRGWAKYYSEEGPIFLRMGNLEHYDVRLDLEDIQRVNPPFGAEGSRTKVEPGDSLISITADVGMVGIVPVGFEEAYINQHVALGRPVIREMGLYLAWLLSGDFAKEQFKSLQRGATKVGLGLEDIKAIQFGLPSLEEQQLIVNRIQEKLSSIERLNNIIDKQSLLAKKQKQTILSSAFAGKLVENDYSGESAADLLERINKERVLLKSKEKSSKRKFIKKKGNKDG
ncbi:MAG: restriction endonuclease subunit S [Candidatus Thiodiazotropha sp. (ex Ctena orbiculata)]|nr:restriction endonuclease subunit S [Candidatus Thiodiazotropha sp. (ex Codakia orbicularis)]MBV2127215.1 restriction endonuclease subunit S [Candidatus Thiodiazotropha taylori]